MKLIRFGYRGSEKPGLLTQDNRRRDCSAHFADWNRDFFQKGGVPALREVAAQAESLPEVSSDVRWGAPIVRPGKVIGIGMNSSDHALESMMPIPTEPIVFLKGNNTVCGPYDPIIIPMNSEKTDWEVELGVIIGRDMIPFPNDNRCNGRAAQRMCLARV